MKQLLMAVILSLSLSSAVRAEEMSSTGTLTTPATPTHWNIAESLTAGMFFNCRNGGWYGGATTPIYTIDNHGYFVVGTGIITPTYMSGNAIPIAMVDIAVGKAAMDNASINAFVKKITPTTPSWLELATVGIWGSRELSEPAYNYGFYAGAKKRF